KGFYAQFRRHRQRGAAPVRSLSEPAAPPIVFVAVVPSCLVRSALPDRPCSFPIRCVPALSTKVRSGHLNDHFSESAELQMAIGGKRVRERIDGVNHWTQLKFCQRLIHVFECTAMPRSSDAS